jgi:rRNA maturation endonuclease Nob1
LLPCDLKENQCTLYILNSNTVNKTDFSVQNVAKALAFDQKKKASLIFTQEKTTFISA